MIHAAVPTAEEIATDRALVLLRRVAARRPRVQCLTNTVAQPITANLLLAAGADVSMAIHPDEILPMASSADALLVNLGTPDPLRLEAIARLAAAPPAAPIVLDPVFVHLSPLREAVARRLGNLPRLVLRGNAAEMARLADMPGPAVRVTTGEVDRIEGRDARFQVRHGHPLMTKVTGMGCAAGALIAAFAAVEEDLALAAAAALTCLGLAAERAGRGAAGPASFAEGVVDSVWQLAESDRPA